MVLERTFIILYAAILVVFLLSGIKFNLKFMTWMTGNPLYGVGF